MAVGVGGEGEVRRCQRLALGPGTTPDAGPLADLHRLVAGSLGTIRTELGRFGRQVSGYALEHLLPEHGRDVGRMLVGSEGTLAVVTQARVRLVTDPPATCLVALGFVDIYAAGDVAPALGRLGAVAAEGIDRRIVDVTRERRGPDHVPDLPKGDAWLFVEVTGESPAEALERARRVVTGVSVLGAGHNGAARQLASRSRDRFAGLGTTVTPDGD